MKSENLNEIENVNESSLDNFLDTMARDNNLVVDGMTEEERNISADDIKAMSESLLTDKQFEDQILTERAINKLKHQKEESEKREKQVRDFINWYYSSQQALYYEQHGFAMSGQQKRHLRKQIAKDWSKGKLKRLFESNLNIN